MANYVVVDLRVGRYVTFYPVGEIMSKADAVRQVVWLNEREGESTHKIMPEMEYYRTYQQSTWDWIQHRKEEKAQRKLARAAKKAAEEKKLAAAKAYWADNRNFANVKPWWA